MWTHHKKLHAHNWFIISCYWLYKLSITNYRYSQAVLCALWGFFKCFLLYFLSIHWAKPMFDWFIYFLFMLIIHCRRFGVVFIGVSNMFRPNDMHTILYILLKIVLDPMGLQCVLFCIKTRPLVSSFEFLRFHFALCWRPILANFYVIRYLVEVCDIGNHTAFSYYYITWTFKPKSREAEMFSPREKCKNVIHIVTCDHYV